MRNLVKLVLLSLLLLSSSSFAGNYTQTKYPIVLVHGLFGFDTLLGVDYFHRIPYELSKDGAEVYLTNVSAANSTEVRGEQLLAQIEDILALSGAEKVNLIGHSHGGPTIRYVASVSPELVASATTVAGVNWGSNVADILRGTIPPGGVSEFVISQIANGLATLIEVLSGSASDPVDSVAAMESLTTAGALAFNAKYGEGLPETYCGESQMVASNDVHYFSWSGGKPFTNMFDPSDAALTLTSLAFNEKNDGLVSSCSSRLGYVIKDDYKMNHLDEVNQFVGIHHLFETDPVTVFRQHANRLKNLGL